MKVGAFVCTYEAPHELDLVLAGFSRQVRPPAELWIADDGSGPETRAVVDEWIGRIPYPVHHVRHRDEGYRKARIMNEAVRRSESDHLIFLDGDSFPHPRFVADHAAAADGERVLCGRRVKLGPVLSPQVTREDVLAGRYDSPFRPPLLTSRMRGDTKRLSLGVRLPAPIARAFHPRPRRLMGVNFSVPRSSFFAVNGFNEDWDVYGHEDWDLELRLERIGAPFYPLLNRAIVYHLWHPERERTDRTREIIDAQRRSTSSRCEHGLVGAAPFDPET